MSPSPRNVAVISGHMFRGSELDAKEQAETESSVRARAEALFAARNVGFVYGALACGADIILAETALKAGAQFEVVLPFNAERFIETSVRIGDPPGQPGKWEERFRAILDGTLGPCTLTIMDPRDPIERDIDGNFFYAFRYAAGCALQRAAVLKTACSLIVVSDATETDTLAGANRVAADWRAHGRPCDVIAYPHPRPAHPIRAHGETAFRPVVFVWDGAPNAKSSPLDELFKKIGKGSDAIERTHGDGRRGLCLLAQTTAEAMRTAREAVEAASKAHHPLRVTCDFGLVLNANLRPDETLIGRLQAAADLPGLPLDRVLATEAFAAQAKFNQGDDVVLEPVGRAEVVPSTNDSAPAVVRSRSSMPIFAVEPAKAGPHVRDFSALE